eukprot:9700719-Karenia_brevis.AAC.1
MVSRPWWHRTILSVVRACIKTSGLPVKTWNWCVQYACVALSIMPFAPKNPWELDASGDR